jgi:hypothetical protein
VTLEKFRVYIDRLADCVLQRLSEITLKDGALDRVYGNGLNPDPFGLGPPDIPHKRRTDD